MKHLLLITIFRVVIISIGAIVICFVAKKERKHRILVYILVGICVIYLSYEAIPNFKDMIYRETSEIEAVYVDCHSESKPFGQRILTFKDDDTTYEIVISSFTSFPKNMEEGKAYKIEYYDNSKVLKSCVLIE